jgi:hypothetical protein
MTFTPHFRMPLGSLPLALGHGRASVPRKVFCMLAQFYNFIQFVSRLNRILKTAENIPFHERAD